MERIQEGFPTGLRDIHGEMIKVGDNIRFLRCPAGRSDISGVWETVVIFADGVFTIEIYGDSVKQIENPEEWNYEHDWIDSRGWAVSVGYGEYGTWNVHRQPLTRIQNGFGWNTEHYEEYYEPICVKYGWGNRYINVEITNE